MALLAPRTAEERFLGEHAPELREEPVSGALYLHRLAGSQHRLVLEPVDHGLHLEDERIHPLVPEPAGRPELHVGWFDLRNSREPFEKGAAAFVCVAFALRTRSRGDRAGLWWAASALVLTLPLALLLGPLG